MIIKRIFKAVKNAYIRFWSDWSWVVWFSMGAFHISIPILNHVGVYTFSKNELTVTSLLITLMVFIFWALFGTLLYLLLDIIKKSVNSIYCKALE